MKKFLIKTEDDKEVEYTVSSTMSLEQVLECLDLFLKSSGYKYYGYLDVFPYDDGK